MCTIREVDLAVVAVVSNTDPPQEDIMPTKIKEVIKEWGCTWMWKSLQLVGSDEGIKGAIEGSTLVAVTDGSYIKERYPHLCSSAFLLKCRKGSGRLSVSFPDCSQGANAYRGELMGLMAIHLILLAANKVWSSLRGRAVIYSDCLVALGRVSNLPPHHIPTKCRHSDILKNILVNCTSLSFMLAYSHVKSHQDDHEEFSTLPRLA